MRIGFIGSGNMAAALARGWHLAGRLGEGLVACDAGSGRASALANELGGEAVTTPAQVMDSSEVVVLATKPGGLAEVAGALSDKQGLLLSVLAGVETAKLEEALPSAEIVRVMPNVGVEIGQGVVCWSPGESAGAEARATAEDLLGALGRDFEVEEGALDAATAAMSCSVAYFALVAESVTEAAVEAGLSAEEARAVVASTLAGTGALLRDRGTAEVIAAVTSPGGSTAAGLAELEDAGLRSAMESAVNASLARMRELGS